MKTNANTVRIAVIVLALLLLAAIIMFSQKQTTTPTLYFEVSTPTPFICSSGENAITRTVTSSGSTVVVYECDGGHYVRP